MFGSQPFEFAEGRVIQKAWASLSFVSPWVKKRCWAVLSEHLKYLVLLLVEIVSLLAVQVFL